MRKRSHANVPDLHCHSTFSFLDGFGSPKAVVERAKKLGWGAACLTEHGWIGSAPPFYKACRENGINPILGCEFYVVPPEMFGVQEKEARSESYHLTVLALSVEGYQNLIAWNNVGFQPENFYYRPRISVDVMEATAPHPLHHNVVLSGCMGSELCQSLLHLDGEAMYAGASYIESMKALFSNFYVEVQNHYLEKFRHRGFDTWDGMIDSEEILQPLLISLALSTDTPIVVTNDSHYQSAEQRKAHIAMMASKMKSWRQDDAHADQERTHEMTEHARAYGYWCVAPQTRVLSHDLRWVSVGTLKKGDRLWGFDENANGKEGDSRRSRTRKWRETEVLSAGRRTMRCFRVTLSNGDVLDVSYNHPWLVWERPDRGQLVWRVAENLEIGDKVPRYLDVWGERNDWGAGWLAGIFDGEGSTSYTRYVKMAQKSGLVLEKVKFLLGENGFEFTQRKSSSGCYEISLSGRFSDRTKFVGSMRPSRLIEKYLHAMEGASLLSIDLPTVVKMEDIGDRDVVTLGTSTKTFLAEGYGAHNTSYMRDMEEVADGLDVAQEAIDNVREIVKEADIRLDPLDRFSYSIPFSGYDDPLATIIKRCKPRLKKLIAKHGQEAAERFDYEMSVMGGFAHYLLIMSDLLLWAREQGILTNTRGSAANSIVCYCLKIHDIDSIEYKLLFSRFVNPARKKLPDIDVDMEKDRYEDFMKHVHEYMEEREGEGQVIQMCNYGTLANRATFRMVAEALGIEKEKMDEIAKLLPAMIDSGLVDEDTDVYAALKEQYPDIYEMAEGIFDNLKNISQHACAWLLGTKERPLKDWVPVFLIASSKKHVTQFNMTSLDDMGLVKGDWLRLRTLSVIKRCLTMIGQDATDLESIPLDDPETFAMLREGRTDGVFTLQGKTNRQGCIECEVATVHDVIASVAIYRPALTRPGLHRVYNSRRRGEEEVTYPHSVAEKVLAESYGIPIFQEQVMDLGYAIGMTDSEVDDLYKVIKLAKGVGRFAKEAFEELRPTIIARACEIMTEKEAENVAEIIGNSQGYGFNRGHASSYGRLAVRAGYLRCHHPQEFFTSLLDVYPEVGRYVAAARSEGFRILRPSLNLSGHGFSRGDDDKSIRIGLARIRDVGPTAVREILAKRPFSSVDDLRERTDSRAVRKPTIEALAATGALEEVGIQGSGDDAELLRYLSFLPEKPKAFTKDIKPKFVAPRQGDRWKHLGLERKIEFTSYRSSVSKLFWVPPLPEKELLRLKTSPWARVKTYLLTVVDENGIPFTIMANEDKEEEADYLKHIARRCIDSVICANGAIRQSFDQREPLGFRLFDVAGAREGEPQVWRVEDERWVTAFNVLHRRKMRARRK